MSTMSNAGENGVHCPASTRSGAPCRGKPLRDSGLCIAHDGRAEGWRVLGGHARSNSNRAARLLPARLLPLVERLEALFAEVARYDRPEKNAACLVAIALAIAKLVQAGEMEERLRDLERLVRQQVQQGNADAAAWWRGGDAS